MPLAIQKHLFLSCRCANSLHSNLMCCFDLNACKRYLIYITDTSEPLFERLASLSKNLGERERAAALSHKNRSRRPARRERVLIFASGNPISQSKNRFLAVSAPEGIDIISDAQIALYIYLYLYLLGLFRTRYTLSQTYPSASVHIFARKWCKSWCKLQGFNLL